MRSPGGSIRRFEVTFFDGERPGMWTKRVNKRSFKDGVRWLLDNGYRAARTREKLFFVNPKTNVVVVVELV